MTHTLEHYTITQLNISYPNLFCRETILGKTTNTNSLHTLSSFLEQSATYSAADSMALRPAQTELVMVGRQERGCLLALAGPL